MSIVVLFMTSSALELSSHCIATVEQAHRHTHSQLYRILGGLDCMLALALYGRDRLIVLKFDRC